MNLHNKKSGQSVFAPIQLLGMIFVMVFTQLAIHLPAYILK